MSENIDNERGQTFTAQKPMTDPTADAAKLLPLFRYNNNGNRGSGLNVGTEEGHVASCENAELADELVRLWNTRPQPAPPAGDPDFKKLYEQLFQRALRETNGDPLSPFIVQEAYRLGLAARPKVEDAEVPKGLVEALRHQRQIDEEGEEVAVNRQACDEAADLLERLSTYLRTKETQLAQADAVIAEYVKDDVIFDAEREPTLKSMDNQREAQRRHQSRQKAAKDKP